MGKRELLIIVAFIVVGLVAYEVTAPPAKEGTGFSLSRLWENRRRPGRGGQQVASQTMTGTIAVAPGLRHLRIGGVSRVLQVSGEDRRDISYELSVESSSSNSEAARAMARQGVLRQDPLGDDTLDLRVAFPQAEGQRWASLVIHVPARLSVRIDHNNTGMVQGVSALELESSGGTISVSGVGATTGYHRNAELIITGGGSVDLTLAGSRAKIMQVTGPVTLNARSGRCDLTEIKGPIVIESASQEVFLVRPADRVHITGRDGKVTIDDPGGETFVDLRGTELRVTARRAVPMTLVTLDRELRLTLAGPPSIAVDALVRETGRIVSDDFALTPESGDRDARLAHTFGDATDSPRVWLRNVRANIVIAKAK